jgi:hypothetical protein
MILRNNIMWKLKYGDIKQPIYSVIAINFLVFSYCSWICCRVFNNYVLASLFILQIIPANINQGFILGKYTLFGRCIDYVGASIITIKTIPLLMDNLPMDMFILVSFTSSLTNYAQITAPTEKSYILLGNIWHIQIAYLFTVLKSYN